MLGVCLSAPGCGTDQETPALFRVLIGYKEGFIDRTGRLVIDAQFRGVEDFSEGLACICEGNSDIGFVYGYVDTSGAVVVPAQYRSASNFNEGLAAVKTLDGWGLIDATGRFVIEPRFVDVKDFSEGLAPVAQPAKDSPMGCRWGYIDEMGELVIPCQFYQASGFVDGLAPVLVESDSLAGAENGGWYFIDSKGAIVLGPYEVASPFHGGVALVITLDGMNAYIDTSGNVVWQSKNIYWDTTTTVSSEQ